MEKNFDWKELLDLHEVSYDFGGTCIRDDGSGYGHPGAKCHKGVEGSPEQYEKVSKSGTLSSGASSEAFDIAKEAISAAGANTSYLNKEVAVSYEKYREEFIEKLDTGEVPRQDIIDASVKVPKGYFKDTEFLYIGMEPGLSDAVNLSDKKPPSQVFLAHELALQKLTKEYDTAEVSATTSALLLKNTLASEKSLPSSTFIDISVQTAARITTGNPNAQVSPDQVKAAWGNKNVAAINMAGVAAFKTQYGNPGMTKVGGTKENPKMEDKMDPKRSTYGFLAGKDGKYPGLTRSYFEKNHSSERASQVADAVIYAAKNGKLKGGYGAPGGGEKYTKFQNSVLRSFHEKGYKVYETEIMLGTGGKANTRHVVHAVDLGNGKTFVSSNFSLNRFGYGQQVNNNPYRAYQAGRTMVETERRNPGSARVWTPPKPKTRATGSTATTTPTRRSTGTTTAPKKAAPKKEETKTSAPKRSSEQQQKLDLRRRIQKAKRDGRDADAAALEQAMRDL